MNTANNFLYAQESKIIYDACSKVWKEFGGAFKESIVDKALTIALRQNGLQVEDQKRVNLYFNNEPVGVYVIDKVINEKIIIEIKCKPFIHDNDVNQFWRYLKATTYKLGFLINFSPKKVEIIRRVYDTARLKT
jgi:GxxExxY protein